MSNIALAHGLSSVRVFLKPIVNLLRENEKISVPKSHFDDYILCKHLNYLINERNIDLVIDVGANQGQFGRMVRKYCTYNGRMMSFEPQPEMFSLLDRLASKDKNWTAFNVALGKEDSSLKLNVMRSSVFSSFLQPKVGLLEESNGIVDVIDVPVNRLDELVKSIDHRASKILLKTDTQGFDLEVIQGAMGILENVEVIVSEVSVIPIYDNCPDYRMTIDTLNELGYVLSGMYPVTLSKGQAVEFDCIMVREHKPDDHKALSYGSMLKCRHAKPR